MIALGKDLPVMSALYRMVTCHGVGQTYVGRGRIINGAQGRQKLAGRSRLKLEASLLLDAAACAP